MGFLRGIFLWSVPAEAGSAREDVSVGKAAHTAAFPTVNG
jgi:hypothetical protein